MNVLIVGVGSIGRKHIAAIRELDSQVHIYALRSSINSVYYDGIKDIYSLSELGDTIIDFVVISNPTSEHIRAIKQLLVLRCPLFVEKPLYHTLDVGDIISAAESVGILTYVACNLRFLDSIKYVKEQIPRKLKVVNEVNVYCGSYLPDWRPGIDFREIYSARAELGGGVNIDLIHELDYLYWIFGTPREINRVFRNNSTLKINSFDYANYCLLYDDFCVGVVLNYYRRDAKRTFEIVSENETWNIDLRNNSITSSHGVVFESKQTIADTYLDQMKYFIGLVKAKEIISFNTLKDAYEVLKICI